MHFALYLYSGTRSHHWSPLYQRPAGSPESKQTIAHTDSRRLQTLCCVNSFSAVYQGAQPKLFEECFRAKKKIPRHFKQHWRDGSSWSRAFKVTELCKRIQVHTTSTERDTSVTGVGPPWSYRPPHKHWSPLKPVSSWGLWSTGARRGPRCKCRFHTVMVAHLWSSFSHTVGIKARCGPNQAQPTSYSHSSERN